MAAADQDAPDLLTNRIETTSVGFDAPHMGTDVDGCAPRNLATSRGADGDVVIGRNQGGVALGVAVDDKHFPLLQARVRLE